MEDCPKRVRDVVQQSSQVMDPTPVAMPLAQQLKVEVQRIVML